MDHSQTETTQTQVRPELPASPGTASLVQIHGDELGKRYQLQQELSLGRSADNHVIIRLDSVSRHHALIFERDEQAFVIDRGSTNGTFVNDQALTDEHQLDHGDLIKIGGAVFRFIGADNAEAQYHEELYRLAITDGLTGLRNRRFFDDFLDREVARSDRTGAPLSLVLIDLDGFKEINDTHGHVFGDRVLSELAERINGRVRREQLMVRFGGDEFALVLPEVGEDGAMAFAERVRKLVSEEPVDLEGICISLTVSIGTATLKSGMGSRELIEAADRAMYRSKNEGRDQVHSDPGTAGD